MNQENELWGRLRAALASALWERDLPAWEDLSRDAWFLLEGGAGYLLDWAARNPVPDWARRLRGGDVSPERLRRWASGLGRNEPFPHLEHISQYSLTEVAHSWDLELAWAWAWAREADWSDVKLQGDLQEIGHLWREARKAGADRVRSGTRYLHAPWDSWRLASWSPSEGQIRAVHPLWHWKNLYRDGLIASPNLERVVVGWDQIEGPQEVFIVGQRTWAQASFQIRTLAVWPWAEEEDAFRASEGSRTLDLDILAPADLDPVRVLNRLTRALGEGGFPGPHPMNLRPKLRLMARSGQEVGAFWPSWKEAQSVLGTPDWLAEPHPTDRWRFT